MKGFIKTPPCVQRQVQSILADAYPWRTRARVADAGVRIRYMEERERFGDIEPGLGDVDAWPTLPNGLFVIPGRCIYLRKLDPVTVVHEFAHAFDLSLGQDGVYRSSVDGTVHEAFRSAMEWGAWVTPYASSGLDEFFAESARSYLNVDDPVAYPSPSWRTDRDRLRACSPKMYSFLAEHLT